MISAAPDVCYIHEPFNIGISMGINPLPFKYWFQYICEENEKGYGQIFENILRFKYPLRQNIARARTPKNIARIITDQVYFLVHKMRKERPLMKDPIAFFSAEWLYKRFNMDVVVMIRHPAAFCASLKVKDWKFDFSNFLDQALLMRNFLSQFEEEIIEFSRKEKDIIEQAILLWNCIHSSTITYQKKYPDWLFIKHEELSLDPLSEFQSIYKKLNLEFSKEVEKAIEQSSGIHNPIEPGPKNQFKRNSKMNIKNWRNRLTDQEIERIRIKTSSIAEFFYSENDW